MTTCSRAVSFRHGSQEDFGEPIRNRLNLSGHIGLSRCGLGQVKCSMSRYMPTMSRIPRYQDLAETLRRQINSGVYPVGAQLPTELEICRLESVSRHTVRDALRLLMDERLVERRQGAGTRVIAARTPVAFIQPLGGIDELMQYARDARLVPQSIEQRALSEGECLRLDQPTGEGWLVVMGLRCAAAGEVLASTTLYVPPVYAGIAPEVGIWPEALQGLITQRFGVQVSRIEQEIVAEPLEIERAAPLGLEAGSAALRTLRRYYDDQDALIVASDSLHPQGRFVYAMTYRREG